jgi:hypothetical protein
MDERPSDWLENIARLLQLTLTLALALTLVRLDPDNIHAIAGQAIRL